MPLPPSQTEESISFYQRILEEKGISKEIKNVVVSKSLGGGGGDTDTATQELLLAPNDSFVTIEFKGEGEAPLELILKMKPARDEDKGKFEKEVFFYKVFLPDALDFVEKKDEIKEVHLQQIFAKCYHVDDDMILLENLLKEGFVLPPLVQPHPMMLSEKVLENVGTFHSVSHCMIKEYGLEEFRSKYSVLVEERKFIEDRKGEQGPEWEDVLEMALAVLKEKPVDHSDEAVTFLEKYKGKLFLELCDQVKSRDEDLLTVLNVGNIWNGTILVKKDEKKKEYLAAVFTDVGDTRLGSPMLDVGCYILSCMSPLVRRNNYDYMLDCYLELLRDCGREMGVKIGIYDAKVPYVGKSVHGIFRAIEFLLTKFYLKPSGLQNTTPATFHSWIKENSETAEDIAKEIVIIILHYNSCLAELADVE